jgi:tight adherence protein B
MFLVLLVFLVGAGAVFALFYTLTDLPGRMASRRVQMRLDEMVRPGGDDETSEGTLIKGSAAGPLPVLDRLIGQSSRGVSMNRWLEQTGVKITGSGLLLVTLAGAFAGFVVSSMFTALPPPVRLVGAAIGAAIPSIVLNVKRGRRRRKFEEQFPEALDLIARALKAGHAFATGLKMAADETEDPVGPEFRKTFDEQNFGLPLKDALANMTERNPSLDVRFFATAVLIQRETGGNLAEILENLARVVRERFKILRQVRVYTAHGRLTGYVLLGLPVAVGIMLTMSSPDSMNLLFRDNLGQMMLMGAAVLQFIGYMWIRQIVKIEV